MPTTASAQAAQMFQLVLRCSTSQAIRGTMSTFSPVTKALRLLVVWCRPSICSQKATKFSTPSPRPQRHSARRMPHHSGSSTSAAMPKRSQMICRADRSLVS